MINYRDWPTHPDNPANKGKRRGKKKSRDSITFSLTDLESTLRYDRVGKKKVERLDTLCSIAIHSVRRRLADADGISGKAAIDGLIHGGILKDDSPKEVESVSYTQEKTKGKEKTIITIEIAEG